MLSSEFSKEQHLLGLNSWQLEAATTTEGPMLVLAGAGTGKTRVLTSRIAHVLLNRMAEAPQILAVTFTNKAAKEMRTRIEGMIGGMASGLWLGTFHSIASRILRQHAELVGLPDNFTIIDYNDQTRLVKQLFRNIGLDEKTYPIKLFLHIINRFKDRAIFANNNDCPDNRNFIDLDVAPLYKEYQNLLKSFNSCDFGDLLLYNLEIFNNHPEICERYQNKFRYLLVDEYQDTNVCQYLWLRLLAQKSKNICCVGDDDQSIYGWRGAEVANILRFDRDFTDAKVIRLELNYRSTPHILAAASALISNNRDRHGKELWTEVTSGNKILVSGFYDDQSEARFIAERIRALLLSGHRANEIAILVRAGFQTRAIEESLNFFHLSYRMVGGMKFYERSEIKDAICYIRLLMNPNDSLAFERIINLPRRGLGSTGLQKLHQIAHLKGCSLSQALHFSLADGVLRAKVKDTLQQFIDDMQQWREQLSSMEHPQLVAAMLEQSGYLDMWRTEGSNESKERLDNLAELMRALQEYHNLSEFLEHVSLVSDGDGIAGEDLVNVMTIHAAKGLEFQSVFATGWEEGVFPSQRSIKEQGLEEERRLAYVAITRVKANLFITFAMRRRIFGGWQQTGPSCFIDELPSEHCDVISNYGFMNTSPL